MADPRGPDHHPDHRPGASQGMPNWSWAAIAVAVVLVIGLLFMWPDDTQQQAETPMNPGTGTTSTERPATAPPQRSDEPRPPATDTTPPPATTTPPAQQ